MAPVSITKTFRWNVEDDLNLEKTFSWKVGEGPLFWFRVEWKDPICPPRACEPSITECSVTETECDCSVTEAPSSTKLIWHVLATSVSHLCERLNTEPCLRVPEGMVFKTVEQYGTPALCCDIAAYKTADIFMDDGFVDVDFCECECVSWVDPCDCDDIHTPCDASTPSFSFAMMPQPMSKPGFKLENLAVTKPITKSIEVNGIKLPSVIKMKHNLNRIEALSKLPDFITLTYNESSDAWQNTIHLNRSDEKWTVYADWQRVKSVKTNDWKFNLYVSRIKHNSTDNTRLRIEFATYGLTEGDKPFDISFTMNTKNNSVAVINSVVVKSQKLYDGINLFEGKWQKDPHLIVGFNSEKAK